MTAPRAPSRPSLQTFALVFGVMSVAAVVMLAASLLTLFQRRRFCVERVGGDFSRLLLRRLGVRLIVHSLSGNPSPNPLPCKERGSKNTSDSPSPCRGGGWGEGFWPTTQTVYVSNHTSALDVFVLLALGLPNTRFFLSGFLRVIVPMGVMGCLAGTFWTVPQYRREDRVRLFQRAARILRQTGESVYLSPEGMRVRTGEIGPFNKGAIHLAGDLGAPLLPLYLAVPLPSSARKETADDSPVSFTVRANLMSFLSDLRPCEVRVYVDSPIDTHGWRLADLDHNREQVRQRFLALHDRWKAV